tara:strand:- start:1170 stop:1478 length:309 start_codon:yes stop_codon:yes gene_type:complete
MVGLIVSTSVLFVVFIVCVVAIRNLLLKNEKYEDILIDQTTYIKKISDIINKSKQHLQNLDEKGVFQSDDEVGHFFEQMKDVQSQVDQFILYQENAKKEKQS